MVVPGLDHPWEIRQHACQLTEGSANVRTLAPPSPCAWTIQWGGGASSWTECPPGCSCSLKSGRLPGVPCTMPTPEVPVGTRRVTASRPLCWCILPLWHCLTRRPQQHHATRARSVAWSAIPPGALASRYGTWPKQSTTLQRSPSCPGDPPNPPWRRPLQLSSSDLGRGRPAVRLARAAHHLNSSSVSWFRYIQTQVVGRLGPLLVEHELEGAHVRHRHRDLLPETGQMSQELLPGFGRLGTSSE